MKLVNFYVNDLNRKSFENFEINKYCLKFWKWTYLTSFIKFWVIV